MHIKELSFTARGRTFDLTTPEPAVHVVVGANATGKTTLLNAVALVCPTSAVDRRPMPGEAFSLLATLDDPDGEPMTIMRKVTDKGDHKLQVGRDRKATITSTLATIHARLGPSSVWSMDDLMGLSPDKALAWLEAQVIDSGVVDIGKGIEPHLSRLTMFLGQFSRQGGATLESILGEGGTFDRDKLVAVITELQGCWREANARVREGNSLIERYEKDRETADLPAGTVETWRAERDNAQAEVERLSRTLGEATGLQVTRDRLTQDIATMAAEYDGTVIDDPEAVRAALQPAVDEAEKVYQQTSADVDKAREAYNNAMAKRQEAEQKKASASGLLEGLSSTNVSGLVPYDAGEKCDRCGSIVTAATAARVAQIVEAHERQRDEAIDAVTQADNAVTQADLAVNEAGRVLAHMEKIHATAGREQSAAHMAMTKGIADAERARERRDDLAQRLTTSREKLSTLPEPPNVSVTRAQLVALAEQHKQADANADRLQDWQGRRADNARHLIELDKAEEDRTEARELINDLGSKGVLGSVLSSGLTPLVSTASEYVERVIGNPLWCEGEGGFQWGIVHAGTKITHTAMSNSERAVAMMFLGIAIKARLGGWRCVVLDDMENLDNVSEASNTETRRDRFILELHAAMKDGLLDEAWTACVQDGWTPPNVAAVTVL